MYNNVFGVKFLHAIERIVPTFKGVHIMCGLSNIYFELPERKFINQTFMAMAIAKGLDGAIVNPPDKRMMRCDSCCMNYLKAYRAGLINA